MHIAIIGAGLAGLTAARQCQAQGHQVSVYEKNAEVSGRMATRHTELGGFDHGAQYFTAQTDRFKKELDEWCQSSWVVAWESKLAQLDQGQVKSLPTGPQRFVPVPGMSALGRQLADGLDVHAEQKVTALATLNGKWLLSIQSDLVPIAATAGPFDAVIIATPAELASGLLRAHDCSFMSLIQQVKTVPCWALMLGFQSPLELPFDGAWLTNSRLAWIARDTSKPLHRAGERWICHATPEWSTEHFDDDAERVKEKLTKAFHQGTGSVIQAIHAVAHRWSYAQTLMPIDAACGWDAQKKIGVCGDWFSSGLDGASRIENAFLSGLAMSREIQ